MVATNPANDDERDRGYGVCFNCPYCGEALTPLLSVSPWHFYHCNNCGPISLPPNGRIRRTEPSDYGAATTATKRAS